MERGRVYIHEFVDIIGHNRANYLHHMTANWGPVGRAERGQLCFGVWAVVGSTGQWPQVVNLWEYADWEALGRNFEVEQQGPGLQDPSLAEWWAAAAAFRSGGFDRIMVAPEWLPGIEQLCEERIARGVGPVAGYAHEIVRCRPGTAVDLLGRLRDEGRHRYQRSGLQLVTALRRAMVDDDECIVIWEFDSWADWARFESGDAGDGHRWWAEQRDLITGVQRILLADAPLAPLRTGRQPQESDRVGDGLNGPHRA